MACGPSMILEYLRGLLRERGVSIAALAAALEIDEERVQGWFDGTRKPSIQAIEAACAALRLALVPIPHDQYGAEGQLLELLSDMDARRYMAVNTNPATVLDDILRDLQLRRLRLEHAWQIGAVENGEYNALVQAITAEMRRVVEAISRRDAAAAAAGAKGHEDVTFIEGDPEGLGYDEELVGRVKQRYLEEAKTGGPRDDVIDVAPGGGK